MKYFRMDENNINPIVLRIVDYKMVMKKVKI